MTVWWQRLLAPRWAGVRLSRRLSIAGSLLSPRTQAIPPIRISGFGYDPQARYDYGYQQTGTLTPVAKSILTSFYGISPVYSYYLWLFQWRAGGNDGQPALG
jgi:hypothetical protein